MHVCRVGGSGEIKALCFPMRAILGVICGRANAEGGVLVGGEGVICEGCTGGSAGGDGGEAVGWEVGGCEGRVCVCRRVRGSRFGVVHVEGW